MSDANEVCYHTVHFSGRVQGVGFRYSVLVLVREFEVTGYVQNLPDGRVRLEVEGEAGEVARFVAAVAEQMRDYVSHVERSGGRRPRQFQEFHVR